MRSGPCRSGFGSELGYTGNLYRISWCSIAQIRRCIDASKLAGEEGWRGMGKLGWSCRPCSLLSTFALGPWDQGSDAPALPLEPSRNGDAWVAKGKMCPPFAPP